jgi:tRNA(adenine34) deaminase
VIVDLNGKIISEGRNKSGEAWSKTPRRIGDSGFAHAEMDAFYRVKKLEKPEECTLYSSLEPCLMCGGAMGMIGLGRTVWACDDPWGGSGRLIAWNQHPAFIEIHVVPHPFADLEREAAALFAPEAQRVYPAKGWAAWQNYYPEICAAFAQPIADVTRLRKVQKDVPRSNRNGIT